MYNLLIADDEQLIREGLSKSIPWKELGYNLVSSVASATQALAMINCSHIDLLLTDIQMPGKSGLDLLAYVKSNFEQMRVIIISGYDRFDYARSALRLGAEDYLLKPIKKKQVIEQVLRIKNELDAYYSEREKFSTYQKNYFFRKLLENTYLSGDELDEIIMRLEIDETASKQYVIYIFDLYKEQAGATLGAMLGKYLNDRIGIYSVVVLPLKETLVFEHELEGIPIVWAKGSSQSIESLCISYERALEQLRHGKTNPLHSFRASFTEHKEIIKILEAVG
jgi:YesN/AraC family two-component response regulator